MGSPSLAIGFALIRACRDSSSLEGGSTLLNFTWASDNAIA